MLTAEAASLPSSTQHREIAQIVARESAETIVGASAGWRVKVVRRLVGPLADAIADDFVAYDRMLGESGTFAGAAQIVANATGGLAVEGSRRVPAAGPLLLVANHPGLSDAVALVAALGREDVWIVAAEFPFLRALRHASRRFLWVPNDCGPRLAAFRQIVSRLLRGDAVVVFPAGGLEVDPAVSLHDARASLGRWSRSMELVARLARGTLVLPAVIRGAVSRAAFDHALAKRRGEAKERQRMAALLQLALPEYRTDPVTVRFGAPIVPSGANLTGRVIEAVDALMEPA